MIQLAGFGVKQAGQKDVSVPEPAAICDTHRYTKTTNTKKNCFDTACVTIGNRDSFSVIKRSK